MIEPDVVMRPMFGTEDVNHSAPSGPAMIEWMFELGDATGNNEKTPKVVSRAIVPTAAIQRAPSGPVVIA